MNIKPLIMLALISGSLSAQTRKYSNEFLSIGVGARALGMSNANVAIVDDVTAGYWNPAGLTRMKSDIQIGGMHAEYFAGIAKYDYAGLGINLDSSSAFALNFIRFGVDDIPNTTELIDADGNVNYDNITSFSAADYAFLVSYARKLPIKGLSVGGNVKIVHRSVGAFARSWGFGLDLGAQYDLKKWRFALMARDVTSTFNAWSFSLDDNTKEVFLLTGNEIPENSLEITLPKFIFGVGRYFELGKKVGLSSEINFDMTVDGQRNVLISSDPVSVDPHLGLEFDYLKVVFLRAGLGNIQKQRNDIGTRDITTFQPNMGLGLRVKSFSIDYAFTDIGDQSIGLYSHIFSVKLDINKRL